MKTVLYEIKDPDILHIIYVVFDGDFFLPKTNQYSISGKCLWV